MNKTMRLLFAAIVAAICAQPRFVLADDTESMQSVEGQNGMLSSAKPFVWRSGDGASLTIPPPKGFSSVNSESILADFYGRLAASDSANITHAYWIALSPDGEDIAGTAYVKELNVLRGKRLTSAEFQMLAATVASQGDTDGDEIFDKSRLAANDALQDYGVTISGGGIRQLPVHRKDANRVAFTMIGNMGDGTSSSITANSLCLFLHRGHVLSFYMAKEAGDANGIAAAVAESRRELDAWCDAVAASNETESASSTAAESGNPAKSSEIGFADSGKSSNVGNSESSKGKVWPLLLFTAAFIAVLAFLIAWICRNGPQPDNLTNNGEPPASAQLPTAEQGVPTTPSDPANQGEAGNNGEKPSENEETGIGGTGVVMAIAIIALLFWSFSDSAPLWAKKAAVFAVVGGVIGAIKGLFGRKG